MKEQQLQKQIMDWLRLKGYLIWRNNTGSFLMKDKYGKSRFFRTGIKGSADIIGVLKISKIGVIMCIEVKSEKGELSPSQKTFLDSIKEKGGLAFVAKSIEDVENGINAYKKELFNLWQKDNGQAIAFELQKNL